MLWRYHAMYFQDDWRVAPHLTLNLGLRYEFNQPTLNQDYKCADFDPTLPNPDRKSTRLNSSHRCISYAVFCLKKKTTRTTSSKLAIACRLVVSPTRASCAPARALMVVSFSAT